MRLGGELSVYLHRLGGNFSKLKKIAPHNKIIFMVKANAYGHGLLDIVDFSYKEARVDIFGLASLGEAKYIRMKRPSIKAKLVVFSDTQLQSSQAKEYYLEYNIIPVISNLEDLVKVLSDPDYKHLPLYLKFDTGMNRLGLEISELDQVVSLLKKAQRPAAIEHVMTHFSSSYLPYKEGNRTYKQYEKFKSILDQLRTQGFEIKETSCANSGAIEQGLGLDCTHIRPGLMLYGGKSSAKSPWDGECISELKTQVLKICPVKRGTPIGYGAHVCSDDGHLVYVALGYGDGILTYYAGQKILLYGQESKILGRVNMDLTTFFFKNLPEELKVNGEFYFWKESFSDITELAAQLKTTPYQVFTAISSRVPRRYHT